MAEAATATAPAPAPAADATPRRDSDRDRKAPKDKLCPFCNQAFTSSSLGRHLDLYVRPKNPKPADGVHNVDEIKKIRGGITRRQVKPTSLKKADCTPLSIKKQSLTSDGSPVLVQSPTEADDSLLVPKTRQQFHDPWKPRTASNILGRAMATIPDFTRQASRQVHKAELDQRQKVSDEDETAKATELALRELLKSVREASAKASGLGLFDFDPCSLSFPSLCLHILPAPSTLFSPTPFPTNESWSIHAPGQKQFDALNRQLRERLMAYQRQRQMSQLHHGPHSNHSSASNSPLPTPPLFNPDPQRLFSHVADAYSHWITLTEKQRQEAWQLEVLRAHARANDLRREAEVSLENARREIEYLKANRWSSGAPELSPIILNVCSDTPKELVKHGADSRNWDYDHLIEKWKTIVRESNTNGAGLSAQKPLPDSGTRSFSMANLPTPSFPNVNATSPEAKMQPTYTTAPPTINDTEPSSDQVDAEGEDDDGDVDLDAEAASDEGSMNDTHHHHPHQMPLQPTPIHPPQMQTHAHIQPQVHPQQQMQYNQQAQVQAHAQAQMQNQQQAQAQAQAQAWARQQMNQSRNSHHHPHQHQQLSPHPSHMGSAANSRRTSQVMIDTHAMNPNAMSTGGMLPMDGIENHQDQFLRIVSMDHQYVGTTTDGV
ncbi:hypothetical protein EJ04DRAFT_525259 [Polyplosphaeria fusca]|uniref:Uncharacterized protein n=1 Tax=Polyplosphaeria fusca TaxID=682080 RepID=A0A9P4QWP8_9PLEO|nr:hypothetical protein EJ04DRAFT_525259 [Polyplosphaeria fusca]